MRRAVCSREAGRCGHARPRTGGHPGYQPRHQRRGRKTGPAAVVGNAQTLASALCAQPPHPGGGENTRVNDGKGGVPGPALTRRVTPMRDFAAGLVLIVVMAMLVAAGWWLRGEYEAYVVWVNTPIVVEAADPVPPPPCRDYWVVGPGDTLWQIAARCYPGKHTGQMVAVIQRLNPGLDPGRLRVGQV